MKRDALLPFFSSFPDNTHSARMNGREFVELHNFYHPKDYFYLEKIMR